MILSDLATRATPSRRLTIVAGAITIDDTPDEHPAAVRIIAPHSSPAATGAPRDRDPHRVLWQPGTWSFEAGLNAGDRFTVAAYLSTPAAEYEVLEGSRALPHGHATWGSEAPVLPLTELYPLSGQAHAQGASASGAQIPVAMWSPAERHSDTGTYETLQAEAPPEFASALTPRNKMLTVGAIAYRISGAVLDLSPPRVRFTLTRAG